MKTIKKLFPVLFALCFLQTAFVQSQDELDDIEVFEGLELVVTASRVSEEAAKVPAQVTVITAEDIAKSGATTVVDVLKTVPGLRIARDRSGTGSDVTMRGISSDYARGKVLVIINGERMNAVQTRISINWDAVNLSDVERIEVLDGGASVQYGDNAQVGVINIITKKRGSAATDVTVSGGSFFQNEQRFSHHEPTGWGSFTVSGAHRGTQGYQKHTASDSGNAELRAAIDINETMYLQANAGFLASNSLFANGLTKAQYDDDPSQNADASYGMLMPGIGYVQLPAETANSNHSAVGISGGAGFTWAISDILLLDIPASYRYASSKTYQPMAMMNNVAYLSSHTIGFRPKISAELQPAGMGLRITGGLDTFTALGAVKTTLDLVKETNPQNQTMSEFTIGPWALLNFEPLSFLSLNAGARFDAAFVSAANEAWSGPSGTTPAGKEKTQFKAFVYEAGAALHPFNFLKVYTKYGTQFRYPYLDDMVQMSFASGTSTSLNTNLKAEKGWTAEGGIGLSLANIAKLDANIYYLRIDNEIETVFNPMSPALYDTINLDPVGRLGTNIGLKLTPIRDYINLDIDYGFVNAVFTEGAYKDKKVPLAAAHTLSGSLMINLPGGLSLGPNVLYKSEMYMGLDLANAKEQVAGSMIWGAALRYSPPELNGKLAVLVVLHNLADTKYASMVYDMPVIPGVLDLGGPTYYIDSNMGRSVNVSLQYRF